MHTASITFTLPPEIRFDGAQCALGRTLLCCTILRPDMPEDGASFSIDATSLIAKALESAALRKALDFRSPTAP